MKRMRPDWRRRTIIVHADTLEVKSAPFTPSKKRQVPKLKRNNIRIYRVYCKPPRIIQGVILGILSMVTLGLAAIAYISHKISRKK